MEQREDQWDVGCLGWTTTLTPGTYTFQVTYRKMDMRMSTDYYAQVTNYVVTPARVLTLPDTTPKRLAPVVELSVNPMYGGPCAATSMRHASLMPSEMKRRRDVRCDSIKAEKFAVGLLGQNEV